MGLCCVIWKMCSGKQKVIVYNRVMLQRRSYESELLDKLKYDGYENRFGFCAFLLLWLEICLIFMLKKKGKQNIRGQFSCSTEDINCAAEEIWLCHLHGCSRLMLTLIVSAFLWFWKGIFQQEMHRKKKCSPLVFVPSCLEHQLVLSV